MWGRISMMNNSADRRNDVALPKLGVPVDSIPKGLYTKGELETVLSAANLNAMIMDGGNHYEIFVGDIKKSKTYTEIVRPQLTKLIEFEKQEAEKKQLEAADRYREEYGFKTLGRS
jgi:hypothetical protein